ncbi:DUF2147 domain-containing protein [Methyloceanibacter sp. wino2]|uniref:DUF2147 domain-containing protein n=1 Tax=Methyloceanibacter sp. wino2 TaxID=2170729 RepID=UPI00131EF81F|nr:DUF2147 domain-containing protein [Methyloceanibacter sp. wino2]
MRHKVYSAVIGMALAAVLVPASATTAQAGDPTGYWRKADQGKYPAKMQLYYCGGRSICVKIAWLQNPRDSKGRVLQDVRNVNPSLRGRTIEGMHIIRGMKQVSASQWKGTVYNPEDGKTYSASVTLASSSKIVLKGCVAAFLCREQVWLRTSAPPPPEEEKKPEPQVEASATPAPAPAAPAAAAPAPKAATASAASTGLAIDNVASTEMQTPAAPQGGAPGLSYLKGEKANQHPAGYTGESVSSMFSMASPVVPSGAQTAAQPAPAPRPAAPAAPAQAAATPQPAPAPASRQASIQSEPVQPESGPPEAAASDAESAVPEESAEAAADTFDQRLSWRERRQMRRQKRLKELQQQGQNLIPWMRQ